MFDFWPFNIRKKSYVTRDILADIIDGAQAASGKNVTLDTAVKVAAVFACVRVISEGVAQVPLKLFRKNGKTRTPAIDHPLYDLLHTKPNSSSNSFQFRETLAMHATLAGKSGSFITRYRGEVSAIFNLPPSSIRQEWPSTLGGAPKYFVRGKNIEEKEIPSEAVLWIPGPIWEQSALEPISIARDVIGLAVGLDESTAKLHKNGVRSGGLLSIEGALKDNQYKDLKDWIENNFEGSANAHKTMILDRGAKFTQTAMTGVDAQQLESRRFQIEEICRIFRVLPIMVCSSDKATTYASAEQMFLAHVVHTLSPWYSRIEQAFDAQLLTEKERKAGFYFKFIAQGLLRGALKETAEYLYRLVSIGILDRNEARELLELNPKDGLDEPLTPLNLIPGGNNATTP